MEATLITHNRKVGAVPITREGLRDLPPPLPLSATHRPVPHWALVDGMTNSLNRAGIAVLREQFAVGGTGSFLFGVMDLEYGDDPQYRASLGLRTSNNQHCAIQIIVGLRVFVCDNWAMSGDVVTLKRRHTKGLDLTPELDGATQRFFTIFSSMANRINQLREHPLNDLAAKGLILEAVIKGVVPVRCLRAVYRNYFEPTAGEFRPRTLWSLHNAFTGAMKDLPIMSGMDSQAALARFLQV